MGFSEWVHLSVNYIKAETEKAFLCIVQTDDDEEAVEIWIPKSIVSHADDYHKFDTGVTMSVKDWFAEQNDLSEIE